MFLVSASTRLLRAVVLCVPTPLWLGSLFCCISLTSLADDTDIFLGAPTGGSAPYIMLTLDYRQDLSGPFCSDRGNAAGQCKIMLDSPDTMDFLRALDVMVNGVPAGAADGDRDGDGLRDSAADMADFEASKLQALIAVARSVFERHNGVYVGLMISNEDSGGTILRGYREFLPGDTNNAKQQLVDILLSLPLPNSGNQYHESQPKELHYEWFRYINGGAVIFGDQTANNFNGTNTPAPDASVFSGANYTSPFSLSPSSFECTSFYEIYATSGNETGSDSDLTAEITLDMNAASAAKFEDMVAYMTNNDLLVATAGDQTLQTWFIQIGSSAAFADDWALAAGTDDEYMIVSGSQTELINMYNVFNSVFSRASRVSTTFTAPSVPVNVFNRIQSLDSYYQALFEPQSTENWPGNIKKFRLADRDGDSDFDYVLDANGIPAISQEDGKIAHEALSYWTRPLDLPPPNLEEDEVDGRDGRSVTRGGAGQKIPGFLNDDIGLTNAVGSRKVFVEPATGSNFDPLDVDDTTGAALQSLLGAADLDAAKDLIAWARGIDIDDDDTDTLRDDARPWLLGDVLHSTPLVINYGTTGGYSTSNPNIRLFFGTNNGFFHIVEDKTSGGAESGAEVFSFIPRELLINLRDLRANNGASSYPSSSSNHPYGMDGEPVALVVDQDGNSSIDGSDEVYIYTGMRRGGKSYYALDASNPSATPQLLWKITKTAGGDFDELGYTFSKPKLAKVRFDGIKRDVLIFGGGFDLNKDGSAGSIARGPDSEGNAIYIVDARTGALIWKVVGGSGTDSDTVHYEAELTHSIPSEVTTLDANGNGLVDRIYVGDTGSVLWRIDIPEGSDPNHRRDNWTITKLANFYDPSGSQDRRFFYPPDIVQTRDQLGSYDGVLIVSGDRANPTETRDTNYMFLVKDRNIRSGSPPPAPVFPGDGVINMPDLADTTACGATECPMRDYSSGWMIELEGRGEKGLSRPLVANGTVFFTSYIPRRSSDTCAPAEGSGRLYMVRLDNSSAKYNNVRDYDVGPGIPTSVVPVGQNTLIVPGSGVTDFFNGRSDKTKVIQVGGRNMYMLYWTTPGYDGPF
ncbi:type IV pilus assembly protein PilY1 [Alteromonadaceae bacterium 2753L.S.0a.02]|nr:type IV pilus assembly protein PilY1 [Alteromonadaceae bacterium 2753L.S.0a.02]